MTKLGLSVVAVGFLFSACSSSTASTTPDQAATDLATAFCNKINTCAPVEIVAGYGTVDACIASAKKEVVLTINAPMTSLTPDREEACVTAANNATCADILDGISPADCVPQPGTVALGSACGDDNQCVTAFCPLPAGKTCGTCAMPPAAGAPCVNNHCPHGLVCNTAGPSAGAANNTCVKAAPVGQACTDAQPCVGSLSCFQGLCVTGGDVGADCDLGGATAPKCNLITGAICDNNTKKCVDLKLSALGGPCGLVDLSFVACQNGLYCKPTGGTLMGACTAQAAEGLACDTDASKGPSCLAPAVCDTGICKVPDPSTCK